MCGVTAEVIVIDNASRDSYPERLAGSSPLVRVIRNHENLGFGAANNRAIRLSQGRYVLILNDDAILQPDSLGLMIAKFDSDSNIAAVGPMLLNSDGTLQKGFTNRRVPHLRGVLCQTLGLERVLERNKLTRDTLTLSREPERSGQTGYVAGACLLVRRKAMAAIGLFDERIYYYYEDVDVCVRLKTAGWGVFYLAEARVVHCQSASLNKLSLSKRNAIYFESLLYYFRKHSRPAAYFGVRLALGCALFVNMFTHSLWGIARRRLGYGQLADKIRGDLRLLHSILWAGRILRTPERPAQS